MWHWPQPRPSVPHHRTEHSHAIPLGQLTVGFGGCNSLCDSPVATPPTSVSQISTVGQSSRSGLELSSHLVLHELAEALSMCPAPRQHQHGDDAAVGGGIHIGKAAVGHAAEEEEGVIGHLAQVCPWGCLERCCCQAAQDCVEGGCVGLDGCLHCGRKCLQGRSQDSEAAEWPLSTPK